jgi:16S rRNA (cytosine1402-N4)-methyltransferase
MTFTHHPVLLAEVLALFQERTLERFVDCTLGLGGHAAALLEAHPEMTLFVGCDQDPAAWEIASQRLAKWTSIVRFIPDNFSALPQADLPPVDGILVDLGVSSLQLDHAERGFSFRKEGPLDMRMNPNDALTAADIVNHWSEADLGRLLRNYGEEKAWRAVARAIVRVRAAQPITTTTQLAEILLPLFPIHRRRKTIHPATLTFQALRLCVNRELEVLQSLLPWAVDHLAPGGRLVILTFHSLEDRIVKQYFQEAASDKVDTSGRGGLFVDKKPLVKVLTRKPIACSEQEALNNPRARSAKLRAVEKL